MESANRDYQVFEDDEWPMRKKTIAEKQELVRTLIPKYFTQMTAGCLSPSAASCVNPYCASCSANVIVSGGADKAAVCAQGIELIGKYGDALLCPALSYPSEPDALTIQGMTEKLEECAAKGDFAPIVRAVGQTFSNPSALCCSFLKTPAPVLPDCPVDVDRVRCLFSALTEPRRENVYNAFAHSLEQLVHNYRIWLTRLGGSVQPFHLNGLMVLMEHPILQDTSSHAIIIPQLCECVASLPKYLQRLLMRWISCHPADVLRKLVHSLQQLVSIRSMLESVASTVHDSCIQNATRLIGLIYDANTYRKNVLQLPHIDKREFANEILSDSLDFFETIRNWRLNEGFTFCDHPFIMTPLAKSELLKEECVIQMHLEQRDAMFRAIFSGVQDPYLSITVRRDQVIRDAINQIASKPASSFKKKLRVRFSGEEGIDEGGVQKEFFQLVFRSIMDPIYGMFSYDPSSRLCWFRPESTEGFSEEYSLVGIMMGLAIYNGVILDVRFPSVVYKKLCGLKPDLNDLKTSHPDLARGLEKLVHFEGDVESVFCRAFQVEYEKFGEKVVVDLKPGGGDIPLTNENREEYVDLYVKWLLDDSIMAQFAAFKKGFDLVTSDSSLILFEADELELLVCGSPELDFAELEESTSYEGGFAKDSDVIKNFWSVVHEFDEEQKKKLLFFATGSDRVPVGGLSKLQFVIIKNGTDDTRLPTAHTCFNVLMLSEYSSREILRERLLTAIQNSEGFGML